MSDSGVGAGEHAARPHAGGSPEPTGVPSSQGPRHGNRAVYVVIAVAVAVSVFSAALLYGELSGGRAPAVAAAAPVPTPTVPASTPTATVTVPAPIDTPVVERPVDAGRGAPPVQITVADLGIDQRLIGLRVTSDRRLQVPESYADIGWWSDGPTPGDAGAALMVGHVDSTDGPAVFYHLSTLEQGAVIAVRRADGRTVRFAVTGRQSFPKDDFPDELVYRTEGKPSLHLVTCGGSFDRESGHYRDNVVVFAELIEEAQDTTSGSHRQVTAPASFTPEAEAVAAITDPTVTDVPQEDEEGGR